MNILITGGAGFIGSNLADKLLDNGDNIFVIDNFNNFYNKNLKEQNVSHNLNNKKYKLFRINICNKSLLESVFKSNKIDVVVHLAASAGVSPSLKNPQKYIRNNICGTVNILECMKKYNIKKLVFASSSSVYGNCSDENFSENLNTNQPISPYAATKLSCEQFIYTYSQLYGINAVCLRFFTVYGPRQRPDLAIRKFTDLIVKNKEITLYSDGNTLRDFTYIDDVVSGICSAIKYNKTPYEIINLGAGKPINIRTVVKSIEKILGKNAKIKYTKPTPESVYKTSSNNEKAKKLLGYSPKTDFETGIKKFIEWYISQEEVWKYQ